MISRNFQKGVDDTYINILIDMIKTRPIYFDRTRKTLFVPEGLTVVYSESEESDKLFGKYKYRICLTDDNIITFKLPFVVDVKEFRDGKSI